MIEKTLKVLNELKEQKIFDDYAVGGAIACTYYAEPRYTKDLDIFVVVSKASKDPQTEEKRAPLSFIFDYLKKKRHRGSPEYIIVEGAPVHFFLADELEREAIKNARKIKYKGVETKLFSPEYLIALALRAGRNYDFPRISEIMKSVKIDTEKLRNIIFRYELEEKEKKYKQIEAALWKKTTR